MGELRIAETYRAGKEKLRVCGSMVEGIIIGWLVVMLNRKIFDLIMHRTTREGIYTNSLRGKYCIEIQRNTV